MPRQRQRPRSSTTCTLVDCNETSRPTYASISALPVQRRAQRRRTREPYRSGQGCLPATITPCLDPGSEPAFADGGPAGCRLREGLHRKGQWRQRERPQLNAAIAYMRKGDTLVVWKLDRLARSLKQLIETIEDLEVRGIGFRSLTEAIDTTTAGGRLVFQIFGALAEFERQVIRERTMAGLAAARAMGRKGGRPPALSPKDSRCGQGPAQGSGDHRRGGGPAAARRAVDPLPPPARGQRRARVRGLTCLSTDMKIRPLPSW